MYCETTSKQIKVNAFQDLFRKKIIHIDGTVMSVNLLETAEMKDLWKGNHTKTKNGRNGGQSEFSENWDQI